jgi:regulator of protease activity HflC (stomatin/prohibitin superfamily)
MSEPAQLDPYSAPGYPQLAQARVPLVDAGEVLSSPDATGRTPIVVAVVHPNRIRGPILTLGGAVIAIGIVVGLLGGNALIPIAGLVAGIAIAIFAVFRAFFIQVPEGANGLLLRKGAYAGTLGPGSHVVPPWIAISHLVTRREIPYDAPVVEAPTRDNVRVAVDSLIAIHIDEAHRFVYNITAADFDAFLAASCQDALRRLVRSMTWDQISDLTKQETEALREQLSSDVDTYGVKVSKVTITYARPPTESEEKRQLAVLQRAEQSERHALDLQRQGDEDDLARHRALARVTREREELQIRIQEAEAKQRVAELEVEATIGRLAKLEDALARYPNAAKYDFEGAQLEAVRSLATNTRAVVQMGTTNDVGRAFVIRDILHDALGDGGASEHKTAEVENERQDH